MLGEENVNHTEESPMDIDGRSSNFKIPMPLDSSKIIKKMTDFQLN